MAATLPDDPAPPNDPAPPDEATGPKRNVVKYGDLTTMEYTATSDLHASLVTPADKGFVSTLAGKVVVETVRGAGVELTVNGTVVSLKQLGARDVDEDTGVTSYDYFGIRFKPGPNDLSLVALGANGARSDAVAATVYGPGPPARIEAHLLGSLQADGKTTAILRVTALDRWNHPAAAGSVMKVSVAQGDARLLPPIDLAKIAGKMPAPGPGASAAPVVTALSGGAQTFETALPDGGVIDLPIVPGLTSGDVSVRFQSADVTEETSFFIRPFLRPPLVVGLINLGIGAVPGDYDGDGLADGGGSRKQRVAIYGTGAIGKSTSATFSYETANRLSNSTSLGSFAANPEDRPYQTYGDSSGQRIDALSDTRLYARLENGHDSLTYGQFMATVGGTDSVGQFAQLMSGVNLVGAALRGHVRFRAFTAKNAVAYAKETFDPSGLATLGQLLKPDIVVGSDVVSLAALDRRTGAILTQTVLQRGVDYTLDYVSGILRFTTIPLPFDPNFNPQVVSVRYEYTGTNVSAQTTGGELAMKFGRRGQTTLSLGYVNNVSGTGTYSLFQQDLSGHLGTGRWSISHASAAGVVPGTDTIQGLVSGGALRASFNREDTAQRLAFSYDDTAAGFANPFGGLTSPGLRDIRGEYVRKFGPAGEVELKYSAQQNHGLGAGSTLSALTLQGRRRLSKRLLLTAGVAQRHQSAVTAASVFVPTTPGLIGSVTDVPSDTTTVTAATPAQTDTQVTLGLDYAITAQTGLSLTHASSLGGGSTSSSPSQTALSLSTAMGKFGRAYIRELFTGAAPQPFAASTSGLASAATATSQTTFGFDRSVGKNTSLTSEYTLEHVGGGTLIFSTLGVKERIAFGKHFSGDAFVQAGNSAGGAASLGQQTAAGGFGLYGISFAYLNGAATRVTGSFQLRTGAFGGANGTLGVGAQISPSVSLLGSMLVSNQGDYHYQEIKIGSAWRPVNNDRGAGLLEIERRAGNALSPTGGALSDVVSYEQVYRPTTRLELSGRFAYKLDGDGVYGARSSLYDARIDQRLTPRFDVGVEARTLLVAGLPNATQTAFGVEGGYRVGSSFRLAAGYFFSAAADPTLSTTPPRKGFYATVTTVVDRIFGWGKQR
jgi:hypothetical protein